MRRLPASLLLSFFLTPVTHAATVVGDYGVSTTGYVSTSQLITTNISLTIGATTWGYISSTASYLPNFTTNRLSATAISIPMPPTAATDAANKAYVDTAAAASGGGSRPVYVGATPTSFDGNMGGVFGANAKCNAAFPGSRMMMTSEIIRTDYTQVSMTTVGWIYCDQLTYRNTSDYYSEVVCRDVSLGSQGSYTSTSSSYPNCKDFQSNSVSVQNNNPYTYYNGVYLNTNGAINAYPCSSPLKIQCVR